MSFLISPSTIFSRIQIFKNRKLETQAQLFKNMKQLEKNKERFFCKNWTKLFWIAMTVAAALSAGVTQILTLLLFSFALLSLRLREPLCQPFKPLCLTFALLVASANPFETICLEIQIAIKVLSFVSECLAILSLGSCNLSRTPARAAAGPLHCSYRI